MTSISGLLSGKLTSAQAEIEERTRTIALCVIALTCVSYGLYTLRAILVPLVLAVALKYLLQPLIDVLSVRPLPCCGVVLCRQRPLRSSRSSSSPLRCLSGCLFRARLPHWLAVCVALAVAFGLLAMLGVIIVTSIHKFSRKADLYSKRVEALALGGLSWLNTMQLRLVQGNASATSGSFSADTDELAARVNEFVGKLPISTLVIHTLTSLLEMVSNLAVVLLFAVYLLLSPPPPKSSTPSPTSVLDVHAQADQQIHAYIRGKCLMSLLVGVFTAVSLSLLEVDLWLVFGLLAFWLNFIPNIGTVLAVALPMPLVIIDPAFSAFGIVLTLLLPLGAHAFAGNVLEPLLFGHTLKLHPVTILISLMVWGSTWGVTGMLMAVPMTAVIRIRLAHIAHPLPQFLASLLVGDFGSDGTSTPPLNPADAASPLDVAPEDGTPSEEGLIPVHAHVPLCHTAVAAAKGVTKAPLCLNDSAATDSAGPNGTEMRACKPAADEMASCYRRGASIDVV